jgi:cell division protein FtsQ
LPGVVGLVLAGLITVLLIQTPLLAVRRFEVTGSSIVSAAQVIGVAAVPLGTPLARVDTGAVAGRVRTLAPVASVEVSRSWPSTLVIALTERVPVAVVAQPSGDFLVLDDTGTVFDQVVTPPEATLPIVVTAPGPTDPATLAALRVLAALTPALRAAAAAVVASSAQDIQVRLRDGRVVVWGDASASPRKAQVATALLGRAAHRIDVSTPDVLVTS